MGKRRAGRLLRPGLSLLLVGLLIAFAAVANASSSTGGPNANQSLAASIKASLKYTGGTAGKANPKLSPIGVGWANEDQGIAPQPGITHNVEAAFKFINDYLGGANGHPLELITSPQCVLGATEAQGTLCAQALLNNPATKVILFGYAPVGGRSFLATAEAQKKVPIVGAVPLSPSDLSVKNAFWTTGGPFSVFSIATFMKQYLHATSVGEIYPSDPAETPFINTFTTELKSAGINPTNVYIPSGATDVLAEVEAANPNSLNVMSVNPFTVGQCIAESKAITTVGFKGPVTTIGSNCLDPAVKAALGDYPKYIYQQEYPNPGILDPSGQTGTEFAALKKFEPKTWQSDVVAFYAQSYFGLPMQLDKWFRTLVPKKAVNFANLSKLILAFHGPIWGGPPKLSFGSGPTPAAGSISSIYTKYLGNGKWKYASGWVNAPPLG
jgi:branched-chain amino acid transport system substrate-binding protein